MEIFEYNYENKIEIIEKIKELVLKQRERGQASELDIQIELHQQSKYIVTNIYFIPIYGTTQFGPDNKCIYIKGLITTKTIYEIIKFLENDPASICYVKLEDKQFSLSFERDFVQNPCTSCYKSKLIFCFNNNLIFEQYWEEITNHFRDELKDKENFMECYYQFIRKQQERRINSITEEELNYMLKSLITEEKMDILAYHIPNNRFKEIYSTLEQEEQIQETCVPYHRLDLLLEFNTEHRFDICCNEITKYFGNEKTDVLKFMRDYYEYLQTQQNRIISNMTENELNYLLESLSIEEKMCILMSIPNNQFTEIYSTLGREGQFERQYMKKSTTIVENKRERL